MARPLSDLERGIIARLHERPEISNRELAEALRVAEATIATRIRALVEDRIITVIAQRDLRSMGYAVLGLAFITIRGRTAEAVAADLARIEALGSVSLFAGSPEIVVQINAKNQDDFTRILLEDIGAVDGIAAVETSLVADIVKFRSDIGEW